MTERFQIENLFMMFKKISWNLSAQLEVRLGDEEVSGTQVYFLVYLLRHHPQGTYLTELSREIGLSKSTLSALIKRLRKSGYLCFGKTPGDVRKKQVCPTEKLLAEQEEFFRRTSRMEAEFDKSLSSREQQQLWNLGQKLLRQLMQTKSEETKKDRRLFESEERNTAVKAI